MRHGVGHIQKERIRAAFVDELNRLFCITFGQRTLLSWLFSGVHKFTGLLCTGNQGRFPIGLFWRRILSCATCKIHGLFFNITGHAEFHQRLKIGLTDPIHIIGVRYAKPFIKAVPSGQCIGSVAKVPLTKHAGFVATVLQRLRKGDLAAGHAPRLIWEINSNGVTVNAGAHWQTPGQQSTTAGRTNRGRHIKICPALTLSSQLINLWRAYVRVAIRTEVSVTHVIGEQYDYVRLLGRRRFTRVGGLRCAGGGCD